LLWRLTGGATHATDITNACRTLLFNLNEQGWDEELLALFTIPPSLLPIVTDNCFHFGCTPKELFGKEIPITAMVGDQQAALIGQACFDLGMVKSTYGTGGFLLMNTGNQLLFSDHQLLTSVAYRINGQINYALEGSIFSAGATMKWLRDKLHLFKQADESEAIAAKLKDSAGVYFVPAFTGMGAPYWCPDARAAIMGLTRDSSPEHIIRAALEATAYQTRDLMLTMERDGTKVPSTFRVDGGMVANNWLVQFIADICNVPVARPKVIETTALGAAFLAGLGANVYQSLAEIKNLWQNDRSFEPAMDDSRRELLYNGWLAAVGCVCQKISGNYSAKT